MIDRVMNEDVAANCKKVLDDLTRSTRLVKRTLDRDDLGQDEFDHGKYMSAKWHGESWDILPIGMVECLRRAQHYSGDG